MSTYKSTWSYENSQRGHIHIRNKAWVKSEVVRHHMMVVDSKFAYNYYYVRSSLFIHGNF